MFNDRLLQIEREIQALKTVRRRTSTTMRVITKQVSATVRLKARGTPLGVVARVQYYGYVEIVPSDSSMPFFFSTSELEFGQVGRTVELIGYGLDNRFGVLVDVGFAASDNTMADGETRDIQIAFYVSCTQDFTWQAKMVYRGEP